MEGDRRGAVGDDRLTLEAVRPHVVSLDAGLRDAVIVLLSEGIKGLRESALESLRVP